MVLSAAPALLARQRDVVALQQIQVFLIIMVSLAATLLTAGSASGSGFPAAGCGWPSQLAFGPSPHFARTLARQRHPAQVDSPLSATMLLACCRQPRLPARKRNRLTVMR